MGDSLQVSGGLKRSSRVFKFLVEEMKAMPQPDRRKFLGFVTARPVVLPGQNVSRQITVTRSTGKMVTASSCDNLLKLPDYATREELHEGLQIAFANLHAGGFSDH